MQDVRKLAVYSEARELAVVVYRFSLSLPDVERYCLAQQMRRAAVSVASNIAEGCGRKGSRALVPFLHYAIGSTKELEFQVELAVSLSYCESNEGDVLIGRIDRTRRMLIRLESAVQRRLRRETSSSLPTPHSPPGQPK